MHFPKWTFEEIEKLKELYPNGDNKKIALLLGKTLAAVQRRANVIGVKKTAEFFKTAHQERLKPYQGAAHKIKHGMAHPGNKNYHTWFSMIARCENKNNKSYERYGGRGIYVCEEWRKDFRAFLRDMGEKPEGMTIGRIDNNGPYCKENCRWETSKENSNNRQSNRIIEAFGEKKTVQQWADQNGLLNCTIKVRLKRGWSNEDSVSKPALRQRQTRKTK